MSDLYWERIQYVGDTKLQSLAWLAATGDDTLYRQALEQFDASRAPIGLTQSRFPAELEQYTPCLLYTSRSASRSTTGSTASNAIDQTVRPASWRARGSMRFRHTSAPSSSEAASNNSR